MAHGYNPHDPSSKEYHSLEASKLERHASELRSAGQHSKADDAQVAANQHRVSQRQATQHSENVPTPEQAAHMPHYNPHAPGTSSHHAMEARRLNQQADQATNLKDAVSIRHQAETHERLAREAYHQEHPEAAAQRHAETLKKIDEGIAEVRSRERHDPENTGEGGWDEAKHPRDEHGKFT